MKALLEVVRLDVSDIVTTSVTCNDDCSCDVPMVIMG